MKVDGKDIAQNILEDLKQRADALKKKGITPHLVIVLVGDDPASKAYVRQKELKGEAIGAKVTVVRLPNNITQQTLITTIQQYNNSNSIHGIIVQRPLPEHIDARSVDEAVDPKKDVDGFHLQTKFSMPLAQAVLQLLETVYESRTAAVESNFKVWLKSQTIVIIGKGETGGRPVIKALRAMGIEPKIIDSKTQNPKLITRKADILITAVGKSGIVQPSMVKKGTILVSVGMYKGSDGKLHGDYNEEEIKDLASFYTPTPGGVGPVNVAMLLENVIRATENQEINS